MDKWSGPPIVRVPVLMFSAGYEFELEYSSVFIINLFSFYYGMQSDH